MEDFAFKRILTTSFVMLCGPLSIFVQSQQPISRSDALPILKVGSEMEKERKAWKAAFDGPLIRKQAPHVAGQSVQRLKVSDNRRFLVKADSSPFFYLGDTAWELFHRLNREEADRYLKNRAEKRFTVIQAVALAELDGLNTPNPYGHRPLLDNDPTKPDIKDGPANDYWDHVDYIVKKAGSLGLFIGFLPTWGDKWNRGRGAGPEIFTPQNAEAYGEWQGVVDW